MALSTEELLRKAILTVGDGKGNGDFGGPSQAPLSIEQVTTFIELMSAGQVMLQEVRRVTSNAAKWQESIIDFSERIARPGVEANRLGYTERAEPTTGLIELSTDLIRGEVPVSDEVFEDNVAGDALRGSLERLIADRFGYDIEDLMLNGNISTGTDSLLRLADGWLTKIRAHGSHVDGGSFGQDYQEIFKQMLEAVPERFLRALQTNGRFYVPLRVEIQYRDILAARGTALGDLMLTGKNELTYQGIQIKGVPTLLPGDPTKANFLLTNPQMLYAGFHRNIRFETFRDPREGVTSFVVTARVGNAVAVPEAHVIAYDVDISV